MEYHITSLADHPAHAAGVAERIYRLWGRLIHADTGMSASDFTEVIRSRAVTHRVPLTLIALAGDELVGTVSLKEDEPTTAENLSPWIGGLLVDDSWRGKGLGQALLAAAEAAAARLGYASLYLSCEPDVEHFYGRSGWALVRRTHSCGDEVALMTKRLTGRVPEASSGAD
ncbi:GNAT family N-acetyltransferase [Massilia niabensis]|uniref:GNAT family N-acetyltransferase n=1 Tax=Massilia niabensis TaxID=544910 RepID=A0ABW0LCR8_9BURK